MNIDLRKMMKVWFFFVEMVGWVGEVVDFLKMLFYQFCFMIVCMLVECEFLVGEFEEKFNIYQLYFLQYLMVLWSFGIVEIWWDGKQIFYCLIEEKVV